jgi:hypothetical protein
MRLLYNYYMRRKPFQEHDAQTWYKHQLTFMQVYALMTHNNGLIRPIGLQGEHGVTPQRRFRRQKPPALFCWCSLVPALTSCLPSSSDNPDRTPPRSKTQPRTDSSTDATGLLRPETRGFCRPKITINSVAKSWVWASGRDTMMRARICEQKGTRQSGCPAFAGM